MESSLPGEGFRLLAGDDSGAKWLPLPISELDLLPLGLLLLRLLSSSGGLWLFLIGLKCLGSSSYWGGIDFT